MQIDFPLQHHDMTHFPSTITGLILKLPFWGQPSDQDCYDDSVYWEVLYSILNKNVNDGFISESFTHFKPRYLCGICVMKLN